jgi:hypothetical protein
MNPDSEVQGCPESVLGFVAQKCQRAERKCCLLRSQNRGETATLRIIRFFIVIRDSYARATAITENRKNDLLCSEYRK